MVNLNLTKENPLTNLKVTLLLESLTSGQFLASIREFPDCKVQAETRETAIAQLQTNFLEKLSKIEVISWNIPLKNEPSWMQFAGIFENDPDFLSIINSINQERNCDHESEVDPFYYL